MKVEQTLFDVLLSACKEQELFQKYEVAVTTHESRAEMSRSSLDLKSLLRKTPTRLSWSSERSKKIKDDDDSTD